MEWAQGKETQKWDLKEGGLGEPPLVAVGFELDLVSSDKLLWIGQDSAWATQATVQHWFNGRELQSNSSYILLVIYASGSQLQILSSGDIWKGLKRFFIFPAGGGGSATGI